MRAAHVRGRKCGDGALSRLGHRFVALPNLTLRSFCVSPISLLRLGLVSINGLVQHSFGMLTVHGLNSVFIIFELIFNQLPIRPWHFVFVGW